MAVLKYLFVFFLVLWLVRSILRGILAKFFGPIQQQAFQQQRQQAEQHNRTGGIHVNQPPKQSKSDKTSDDYKGGDYIEYEEVD